MAGPSGRLIVSGEEFAGAARGSRPAGEDARDYSGTIVELNAAEDEQAVGLIIDAAIRRLNPEGRGAAAVYVLVP